MSGPRFPTNEPAAVRLVGSPLRCLHRQPGTPKPRRPKQLDVGFPSGFLSELWLSPLHFNSYFKGFIPTATPSKGLQLLQFTPLLTTDGVPGVAFMERNRFGLFRASPAPLVALYASSGAPLLCLAFSFVLTL